MTDKTTRDDWGFTDADHAELRALMQEYRAQLNDVMLALMQDGVKPEPHDPGIIGSVAQLDATIPGATTRVFPNGGLWWALLESLRALDHDDTMKGGA